MKTAIRLLCMTAALMMAGGQTLAQTWTYPVREVPLREKGSQHVDLPDETVYQALDPAQVSKHRMCMLLPHTQDTVIMAYMYGAVDEARRLGQAITLLDAGGYSNDSTQRAQFENCLTLGVDAVLLQPINPGGWETDMANARARGVKIINVVEPVDGPVDGRSVVDFRINGELLGQLLAKHHPAGSPPVELLMMPGAAGLPFVEDTVQGLRQGIANSSVRLVNVMYGDMNASAQLKLVEDGLVAWPDVRYIVGNGIVIKQAVNVLAQRGMRGQVQVLSTYLDPDLLGYIKSGRVLASAAESSVMINRIAVNLAVAAIEGKEAPRDMIPHVQLVTREVADDPLLAQANFQPQNWRPVFRLD